MNERELTISDVLADPLIRQVMQADRISIADMVNLLHEAARNQKRDHRRQPMTVKIPKFQGAA